MEEAIVGGEVKMRELSLHILDIAQNSIRAYATEVRIELSISTNEDRLMIEIEDNGTGMSEEMVKRALDPFVTTRTTRRVGLGLSLFKAAAEQCLGDLQLKSEEGEGTYVKVWFQLSHIDRAPLGDLVSTIVTLIQGSPDIDFLYIHRLNNQEYILSTKEMRQELENVPLNHPLVLDFITKDLHEGLADLLIEF